MRRVSLVLISALALSGAACKGGHNLVGKWSVNSDNPEYKRMSSATIEFGSDGKMKFDGKITGQIPLSMTFQGTYTLTDDNLKMVYTGIDITSSNPGISAAMQQNKSKMLDQVNAQGVNDKIKWNSNDSITITDPTGKPTTLTRVPG